MKITHQNTVCCQTGGDTGANTAHTLGEQPPTRAAVGDSPIVQIDACRPSSKPKALPLLHISLPENGPCSLRSSHTMRILRGRADGSKSRAFYLQGPRKRAACGI